MTRLDKLRAEHPHLGFAVYAIEPGGVVTLEVFDGGAIFTFRAESEAEALAMVFRAVEPEPRVAAPAINDLFE